MNWPAPTILEEATPSTPAATDSSPPPESAADRRGLTAVPAAAWLALLGTALLLVAAVGVVASNWSAIGQSFRVAGLCAVTIGLLFGAGRLRTGAPTTAGIVAHLGTFLTAFVGIAVLSRLGFTWPACLVAGGSALAVATAYQAERWRRFTMHMGQVAGIALAATGVAALADTTAGLVAVVAAAGLLAAGGQRRATALSMLAVLSPVLAALADAGIGAGTFERAGLIGERLSWSGPVVGLLAATIIGSVAMRRRNDPLVLLAAASPLVGVVAGLAAIDGSAVAWWCVPALGLIAAELGWWAMPTDRIRSTVGDVITACAGVVAALAWTAPAVVRLEAFDADLAHPWALPVAVTTLAVALTTLRWRSTDSTMTDLGIASVAAGVVAISVSLGAPDVVDAVVALIATAGAAFASRRLSPVAIQGAAFWALLTSVAVGAVPGATRTMLALALVGGAATLVVLVRGRLAASSGLAGRLEIAGIATAAAWGAAVLVPDHSPAATPTAVALVAALSGLVDRRLTAVGIAFTGATGALALTGAATAPFDTTYWIGWATAAVAWAVLWAVHRVDLAAYASASAAVLALASGALALGSPADDFVILAIVATVALTGVACTLDRRTPLDAAAVTAGGILLLGSAADVAGPYVSGAWTTIGFQIAAFGIVLRNRPVAAGGAAVAFGGATSFWFTTGWHDWFVQFIEPADITVADAWMAGASIAALVAGHAARRVTDATSWIAYTAALAIPGLWLTAAHLDRQPVWALPLLLTIGVAATAAGAWHRLAAPLVGGTALSVTGVFLATGSDLTAIPTWVWLGAGGAALLGVAVLIERAGRVGTAGLRELVDRWD